MPKYLLFFFILSIPASPLKAQINYNQQHNFINANKFWAMWTYAGVDFSGGGAKSTKTALWTYGGTEGATAVSDPVTGKLLFYSNGEQCWNRNNQLMPHGDSLLGNGPIGSSMQGACIVPVIDTPGKYYLFSLNYQGNKPSLYYSVIDMSLESGLGDLIPGRKNIVLDTTALSEAMIAIPGNNCDIWLLVHSIKPVFKAYHITRDGINKEPMLSTGNQLNVFGTGFMAISPNRKILAFGSSGTRLFTFNPEDGALSGGILISSSLFMSCFSPDNTKLYCSNGSLFQFDISNFPSGNIPPPLFIANGIRHPRLYNDTIYANRVNGLARIKNANQIHPACIYEPNFLAWQSGAIATQTLGSEVIYPLSPTISAHFVLDTVICTLNTPIQINLKVSSGYKEYLWNDGDTINSKTITQRGIYWVLCKDPCRSRIDTFIIGGTGEVLLNLGPDTIICHTPPYLLDSKLSSGGQRWNDGSTGAVLPVLKNGTYSVSLEEGGCTFGDTIAVTFKIVQPHLGEHTLLCKEKAFSLILNAAIDNPVAQYIWSTGSNLPEITVQEAGIYKVSITDTPCVGTDSITIIAKYCECQLQLPSAFSPNDDGINDIFKPVMDPECNVKNYKLSIYNRWGQQIFNTSANGQGWDGTLKGQKAELGTYMYFLSLEAGTTTGLRHFKGDLILIR